MERVMTGTKEVGECWGLGRRAAARVHVQLLVFVIGPPTDVEAEKGRWHQGLSTHAQIHESCNGRKGKQGRGDTCVIKTPSVGTVRVRMARGLVKARGWIGKIWAEYGS